MNSDPYFNMHPHKMQSRLIGGYEMNKKIEGRQSSFGVQIQKRSLFSPSHAKLGVASFLVHMHIF